ncbi:uncharacterized protein FOBCDRAFT_253366 [Fusarium oxysporum Fo47]|uniref:uncharacterized protein n=1 Tax=Fusarium oxysporum Fo47 TaxID=660027 RepID=UPI0028699E70|nr:uncharacterized protein FOBCDRAFT_253366 [Fusarium oxysporum Fo47]WJG36939.1 hypothetical protein FOBCDRAFT_253366 [Fusarium oxysporum Fo47]
MLRHGEASKFWDPLVVIPVVLAPSRWLEAELRVLDMLRAFFTPPYLDWWLAYTDRLKRIDPIDGHWLLHQLHPSMIQVKPMIDVDGQYPLLGDHSRSGIRKVNTRFIGTHARLASSMRWLGVRKRIADNETVIAQAEIRPSTSRPSLISVIFQMFRTIFWRAWLTTPQFIRLSTTSSLAVSRLPFGLYLKFINEGEFNESNAIRLVRNLRGEPLARAIDMLSDRDCHEFVDQMQSFIPQIRAIPPVGPKNHIYNTLGQACSDPRIRDGNLIGPFDDEASFSQYLRHPDDPARRCHQVVFTPSDLNLRNILVNKLTRLDETKENSGFHPEYWDFTKAQFEGFRWDERWARAWAEVFRSFGGYAKEIELGKRSWTEGDGAF